MKMCQKVKGSNGCLCAINSGKPWVTMLSGVTPKWDSIKVVDNLIPSLRSLHWLLAVGFPHFITLLSWMPEPL